jgi:hypothetical protein
LQPARAKPLAFSLFLEVEGEDEARERVDLIGLCWEKQK